MAGRVGFEPTVGCPTLVFKTSALDHSATCPISLNLINAKIKVKCLFLNGIRHSCVEFEIVVSNIGNNT